ncbi:tetratricopeptide repeat protein, partial [Streptomyces scabiei]|uniref:tetratricopeptide repeat protein n=1 Tax=Streptomyces scabiei TaxID=1930 RepID=UPI0038F77354
MPAAMLLTGALEWQAGNHDLAVGVLERLVRLQPDNATARATLARALAAKGDWRRLVDLFAPDCATGRGDAALAA